MYDIIVTIFMSAGWVIIWGTSLYLELAYFVCYLKVINTFFWGGEYIATSKELKNGIGILVGQAVFNLRIKY